MWKYALAWLPMVAIAVANGALRDLWYGKRMSELAAHQLSTASGLVLLGVYMWAVMRLWPAASREQALLVGGMWLVMTLAFELLFGRFVARQSWVLAAPAPRLQLARRPRLAARSAVGRRRPVCIFPAGNVTDHLQQRIAQLTEFASVEDNPGMRDF